MLVIRSATLNLMGSLWAYLEGRPEDLLFGPVPCRCASIGFYRVVDVVHFSPEDIRHERYGPAFIALDPIAGDGYTDKLLGISGFGIRGGQGDLHIGTTLLLDEDAAGLAKLIETAGAANTRYICEVKDVLAPAPKEAT